MSVNLNSAPYYDRYVGDSDHKRKGYTRVLAKPGYAEQASEFNEAQSIQRDYLERLGKAVFKDGYIVSGCEMNINERTVTIAPGRIFLDGLVRDCEGDVLQISGIGTERVVAYVETSIVTENEDASLRDPAQGAENYGLAGAHRERQVVRLKIVSGDDFGEEQGSQIYQIGEGDSVKEDVSDDNSFLSDVLAERTYDENGNFKVSGLNLRKLVEEGDNHGVKVYITEGKAYVRGYEVTKGSMSSVTLNPSTDTRFVQSESHYYSSTIGKYELSNGPIASVQNMTCLVAVTGETKYRGNIAGGYDSLIHTPVDTITRVYEKNSNGQITKTYRPGIDYKLYNDQVDWSVVGDDAEEPASGTTYYVDYLYNKTMVLGTDFDIENTRNTAYMYFLDNGSKPDENSRMYISYFYTLARRDLVLIDAGGVISVMEGVPDKIDDLITPFNGSTAYLELGYVDVYPINALTGEYSDSNMAKVYNYENTRLTQDNFYSMLRRIEDLESSISVLDLERSIEDSESANLKGYFVDNFESINKSDLNWSENQSDGTRLAYTACIDYNRGEVTTGVETRSSDLVINDASSDEYATYGTIISAPYELELALSQKYVTGTMKVNPYASYGPMCQVLLEPSIDNWVDEDKTVVHDTVEDVTYQLDTRTYSRTIPSGHRRGAFIRTEESESTNYLGTTTSTSTETSVAETVYEFMRSREVQVQGRAFSNGMKNIQAFFNEIPVSLNPSSGTSAGSPININGKSYTTVNADENGSFDCTFIVPEGVPCGVAEVKFVAADDLGDEYSGTAVYTSTGTLLTTTITNTTTVTQRYQVLKTVTNVYSSDPLAQTFIMSDRYDRNLIKLGLYFAKKSNNRPLIVQIRDVVNGYPGETVYAEVSVAAKDVNIPTDPNVPVVTEVVLNQPVYCKAGTYYCFVVLSDSNAYEMYYADMGQTILGKTESLVVNPYATGVMFSSSNSSTWTAHQGADLRFDLYRSRFTGSGEILFNNVEIDSNEITGLLLDAAYEDNNNNGLKWYYQYSTGTVMSEWLPLDTLVYRDLRGVTNKISLKAVITTDFSTSPFIDAGRVSLRSFVDDTEAVYISKHLTEEDFDEEYQSLKISYQAAMPSGADHKIYYADTLGSDGYVKWVQLTPSPVTDDDPNVTLEMSTVDEEFVQYDWTIKKVDCMVQDPTSSGSKFFKLRADLTTNLRYNRPRIRRLSSIFKYNY